MSFIPMRSEYEFTNPYHLGIAVALAAPVALVRALPRFSLGLVVCALLVQTVAWPSRFSNVDWTAYLLLVPIAAGLSFHGPLVLRRAAVILALPISALVSGLLNVPALSTTGEFGLINGKPVQSPDVATGFTIFTVVLVALLAFAWHVASLWRTRARAGESFDSAAGDSLESIRNPADLKELTPREREVYFLIAEGLTTNEIAAAAHIEESTVKSHISSVLSKLRLASRTAIVAHAYRNGVLVPAPTVNG